MTTKNNLAVCFLGMKKFDKACQLFQEVEEVQQKTLCSTHPDYLTTKNNLAGCFLRMKKFDKACQLCREILDNLKCEDDPELYESTENILQFFYSAN